MKLTREYVHAFYGTLSRGAQIFQKTILGQIFNNSALRIASLFSVTLFIGAFLANRWVDLSYFAGSSFQSSLLNSLTPHEKITYSLNCTIGNSTKQTCSTYPRKYTAEKLSSATCPEYFKWIYEDLRMWKDTGITKELMENASKIADVRLVVVDGTVYLEKHRNCYQTRDVYSIWGILQLLRFYPGKLPNLDMVFTCGDKPNVKKENYKGKNGTEIPPVFHYCGDSVSHDIVFPDWSFWGWPEINIPPWTTLKRDLEEGNHKIKWMEREPYAYWKGNEKVSPVRQDLLHRCNLTDDHDWNARIYSVTWGHEISKGFRSTNLADQCTHRFKIYVEGQAWSVSEKYILACDSMSLLITPFYYDFFTRSLLPTVHYWPINHKDKCRSIKYAVDWGNRHPKKAHKIGREASRFIQEELTMNYVYDYLFHLLNTYAKLLKYKPTVPHRAKEVCLESMACKLEGRDKQFMVSSMVMSPSDTNPCEIPPPYTRHELEEFLQTKHNLTKKIEMWQARGKI